MRPALVLAIAFAATALASLSGGSASALTVPAWLAMGVPLPTAVGTEKVAAALWTLVAGRNYLRRRVVDWPLLGGMLGLGLVGAWFGPALTIGLDPEALKRVIGGLILGLAGVVLVRPRLGAERGEPRVARGAVAAAALPLGVYEGMLGTGSGIVASVLFCWGRGFHLIAALGHYSVMAFAWCTLAAGVYIGHGYYDLSLMVPAALGSCAGGYLGSRIAVRRGAGFVRGVFVLAGSALGLKLLLGF